MVIYEGAQAID